MPTVRKVKSVIRIRCKTALEFLQVLNPVGGCFESTHIYRGVSSSHFQMIPSAHRAGAVLQISEYRTGQGPMPLVREQCAAEFFTLSKFFTIAAQHGARLPEDSFFLRAQLERWRADFERLKKGMIPERAWPSPELFALAALAQHYGVPTRALDWTSNAYVAAYFAARSALAQPDGDMAVWAFDDLVRRIDRRHHIEERPLVIYTVGAADNDNLRAQHGLFMIHPQARTDPEARFEPKPYDEFLMESLPTLRQLAEVVQVLVPASESRNVLALLRSAGVSAGAVFPGLWGVAREYEEEQLVSPGTLPPIRMKTMARVRQRVVEITKSRGA